MISGNVDESLTLRLRLKTRGGPPKGGRSSHTESELEFIVDTGFTGVYPLAIREDALNLLGAPAQFEGEIRLADGSKRSALIHKLQVFWNNNWINCLAISMALPADVDDRKYANNLLGTKMLQGHQLHGDVRVGGNFSIV